MGLFTLDICCATYSLDCLKSKLEAKSRLPIPEFSYYHCKGTSKDIREYKFEKVYPGL